MTHNNDLPVLFLDFDGVLRPASENIYVDEFGPAFDVVKCEYIAQLQQQTNCRVVVIASWINRCEGGIAAMHRMEKQRNLPFHIHDTIKTIDQGGSKTRSDMITNWLKENNHPRYCIIDDSKFDFFSTEQMKHQVCPDFKTGMVEQDYYEALALLPSRPNLYPSLRP